MGEGKGLINDGNNRGIQVFAPRRTVSVTAAANWEPNATDVVFAVTEDVSYTMDGGTAMPLSKGAIRGIIKGVVYTFSETSVIEVM